METTIKINTDSLTPEFIEDIQKLFPHQKVEITIQPADETEYVLKNPSSTKVLEDRIADYKAKKMKKIKYVVFKEDKYFVSQCLNVDVSSFGNTIQEAIDNLSEALSLYFDGSGPELEIPLINETLLGETFINV
jgi:predicted RNase H-like HicB family nuclease